MASNVSVAVNALSLDLFRALASSTDGNLFFSPLSISTCLGMLLLGTRTDSESELFKGLSYDKSCADPNQVHSSFKKLLEETLKNDPSLPYALYLANRVLIQHSGDPSVINRYKELLKSNYKAVVDDVDFGKDGPKLKGDINNWVADQTKGMIKTLLDSPPSVDTRAILLNAVYFKGSWEQKFDSNQTKPGNFYNKGKDVAVSVPFMHLRRKEFNFIERELAGTKVQVLEMPYAGNISMYIVLPDARNGLEGLTSKITLPQLDEASEQLFLESEINLTIPKFKFESKFLLNKALETLGVKNIFTRNADLSGINGERNLFVSEVLHKAVVDVNEEGTEAAAATSVGIMLMSMPMQHNFVADHPFLFFIKDKASKIILFMGKVDQF